MGGEVNHSHATSEFSAMASLVLAAFGDRLHRASISPELEVSGTSTPAGYSAEVRVFLWDVSGGKKNSLADILEFHFLKGGRQCLSLDEARSWLEDNIEKFLETR